MLMYLPRKIQKMFTCQIEYTFSVDPGQNKEFDNIIYE